MTIFACVLLLCLIGTVVYFKRTNPKTDSDEKNMSAIQVQNSTRSRMPTPALIRNPINENEIYVDPGIRFSTILADFFLQKFHWGAQTKAHYSTIISYTQPVAAATEPYYLDLDGGPLIYEVDDHESHAYYNLQTEL